MNEIPYPRSDRERLVWLEENLAGLRRELEIEFAARNRAAEDFKDANNEWKRQANEWRATVTDVGFHTREELRSYVDIHVDRAREYIDERVKFMITLMSTGVAVLTGVIILEAFVNI
jgi:hypothetical protein